MADLLPLTAPFPDQLDQAAHALLTAAGRCAEIGDHDFADELRTKAASYEKRANWERS